MKRIIYAPAGLSLALLAGFAMAQGMAALTFAGLDADADGAISAEELAEAPPVRNGFVTAEALMTAWDADTDGSISEEEFDNRPAGGMGGMGGMGMGG